MGEQAITDSLTQAPKGLATVAFLKTRLDEGHDHLGLFEPLIYDALLNLPAQDFVAADIKALIHERTGILLPADTIQTLLGRCKKRGFLLRQGGRFFRTSMGVQDPGIHASLTVIKAEQLALGRAFVEHAAAVGIQLDTAEQALHALAAFVSDNKVRLILKEVLPDSPLDRSSLDRKLTRLVARFITERCFNSAELRPSLAALTEGIILHDMALMCDFPRAGEKFRNLLVVFDTSVVLSIIGLHGTSNSVAAREALTLLREAGARTAIFRRTVDEVRNLLAVYEQLLATTEGRLSMRPTPLAQHALSERLSSADFRMISATLESRLARVGITIRDIPKHDPRFTLGEAALSAQLADSIRPDTEAPRVRHDVDCIAGILTLRAGRTSTSIEHCVAIFCTASGRVVQNVQRWFFGEGEQGVPPIVHQAALTSIAWLKKPAAAPSLKMHELAALCLAAMRPTRETWGKFVVALRRMQSEGVITDDETAAIVASELTEPLLARLDDDFEPDAHSIEEAIVRVREEYRCQASSASREAIRVAQAQAQLSELSAKEAIARKDSLVGFIERRILDTSRGIALVVFGIVVVVVVSAAVLSFPGVFEGISGTWRWVARGIFLVAAVLGVISAIRGTTLTDLRVLTRDWIADRLRSRWFPKEAPNIPAGESAEKTSSTSVAPSEPRTLGLSGRTSSGGRRDDS